MPELEDIIIRDIAVHGPMDIGQFMSIALSHPEHGYYMKKDPFGRAGDFITAPEVSQMFGEMLGAWCADIWMQLNTPERFVLLECGPGRGTLMADMLRACKNVKGFSSAAEIHLMEISPALKEKQKEALQDYDVRWHESLEFVPEDAPIILIANEFLDALPFRQIEKFDDGWRERVIYCEDGLKFGHRPAGLELSSQAPEHAKAGDIFEVSPSRCAFISNVAESLSLQGGAALFIDYGHIKHGLGDTFQALKGHEYVDVLSNVGDADLTSHVDFQSLMTAAHDVHIHGPVEQGAFLKNLGIGMRAKTLMKSANGKQAEKIEKDLHRLCDSGEMGALFKVLGLSSSHGKTIQPAGF